MRTVALISDLHASLVALDDVLADIRASGIVDIVCLGDVVDLGPEPVATVQRLRERGIPCVQGNHDVLNEHPKMKMLKDIESWTREQLDAETRAYLDGLPRELCLDLEGTLLRCVHGTPDSFHDPLLPWTPKADIDRWVAARPFDILAAGHTHVPLTRFHAGHILVNAGSVALPFAEPFAGGPPKVLPCSDYAVVRAHGRAGSPRIDVEHRRLPLDLDRYRRSVRESTLPSPDEWLRQWD